MVTSTRFAERLKNGIQTSELYIFEDCSHAPLYENVPAFNEKTLAFLKKTGQLTRCGGAQARALSHYLLQTRFHRHWETSHAASRFPP